MKKKIILSLIVFMGLLASVVIYYVNNCDNKKIIYLRHHLHVLSEKMKVMMSVGLSMVTRKMS